MVIAISLAVTLVVVLLVGFLVKGPAASDEATNTTAASGSIASGATDANILSAMEGGSLAWNGAGLTYASPTASISLGAIKTTATYVDANTSIEQAVALAIACFDDSKVTSFTFESVGTDGTAAVTIVIDPTTTTATQLKALESGTPEAAYSAVSSYTLTKDVLSASGYTIAEAGGTAATS
jgi:hypothetical protein